MVSLEARLAHAAGAERRELLTQIAWKVRRVDIERARSLAARAIEEAEDTDPASIRAGALLILGVAKARDGGYVEAIRLTDEGLDLLGEDDDPVLRCRLHGSAASHTSMIGEGENALRHIAAAAALAKSGGSAAERAWVAIVPGTTVMKWGDIAAAATSFQAALNEAPDDEPWLKAEALCSLGSIENRQGRSLRALEILGQSLDVAVSADDPDAIARARMYLALAYKRLGSFVLARRHLQAALAIVRESGPRVGLAAILTNLAVLEDTLGDPDAASARGLEALEEFAATGHGEGSSSTLRLLGDVHTKRGELDKAEECFTASIEHLGSPPEPRLIALGKAGLGRAAREKGTLDEAARHFCEAVRLLEGTGSDAELTGVLLDLGSMQINACDYTAAIATLERAVNAAKTLENVSWLAKVRRKLARAHEGGGDHAAAYRESSEAQRLGDAFQAAQEEDRLELLQVMLELELQENRAADEREHRESLERANGALSRANNDLRELVATTAHDLRNPLHAVIASGEILSQSAPELPERADRSLARIVAGAEQMAEMITSLLGVGALASSGPELELETLALGEAAATAVAQFRPIFVGQSLGIALDNPDTSVQALVNPIALGRCLDNLLGNALKFTPPGGRVLVRVEPAIDASGAHVARCEVHDTGPGVGVEDRESIFGKYITLSPAPPNERSSTGLGLYIVRKLVRLMAGTIECRDTPLGGACFRLDLPTASS